MSDELKSAPDLPLGELREITLRIPGECFFCETIDLPNSPPELDAEKKPSRKISPWDDYICQVLGQPEFSPYPIEQLAWGYHLCDHSNRALIFATPLGRLRQLGWQNLELFRRVFPSFVSLFAKKYDSPTAVFLLFDESLSLACFDVGTTVPNFLYSRSVDVEDDEGFEKAKSMLLGLVDLSKYDICSDVLIAREVYRRDDNAFEFEHQWMVGKDSSLELDQDVVIDADTLWQHDLRSLDFKIAEKSRRRQERARWKTIKGCIITCVILIFATIGIKISDHKLEELRDSEKKMKDQVPLVLESQNLLEKLKQNQLGGIDPFETIGRVAAYRGGGPDNPHVWFSHAHFETRNHIKIEGEGRNVESVNNFIEKLEKNKIALVRSDRSKKKLRSIKSGGGSTSFEVEFEMLETTDMNQSVQSPGKDGNESMVK